MSAGRRTSGDCRKPRDSGPWALRDGAFTCGGGNRNATGPEGPSASRHRRTVRPAVADGRRTFDQRE